MDLNSIPNIGTKKKKNRNKYLVNEIYNYLNV